MRTSEMINELIPALVQARPAIGVIVADKKGPPQRGDYPYVSLEHVLEVVCPILGEYGLVPLFGVGQLSGGMVEVHARLFHTSGQWIENHLEVGPHKTMHELGSDLTYAERYLLMALLAIQPVDKDDDGQSGAKRSQVKPRVASERPEPSTAARPERPASHGPKPTPKEVEALLGTLTKVYGSDEQTWAHVVAAMPLPTGHTLTRARAKLEMSREQYDHLTTEADAVVRTNGQMTHPEDDVTDFSVQIPSESPQDDTQASGEGSSGSEADASHLTPESVVQRESDEVGLSDQDEAREKLRAEAVGWDIEEREITHILKHHKDLSKARTLLWQARSMNRRTLQPDEGKVY